MVERYTGSWFFKGVKIYKKLWDNQAAASSFHQIELSKNIDISG